MSHRALVILFSAILGCHAPIRAWPDLARTTGCTPALLASASDYAPSRLGELTGQYTLVQIDTARGWIELKRRQGTLNRHPVLTLWSTDSLHRFSRENPLTKRRVPADIALAGALSGYERAGFTPDRPQVEVSGPGYDWVVIRFQPELVFDAPLWELPIQRLGSWGFGGYFTEGSIVVPVGEDGRALGQRSGFYCAFKR
jgi:hypothetical protein